MTETRTHFKHFQEEEALTDLQNVCAAYVNMVYAAALRQVGDVHLAEDVTQAVFVVLARRGAAGKLPKEARMAGWLLTAVHYGVKEARRAAIRRSYHERRAATMRVERAESRKPPEENAVLGLLDDALMKLGAMDQELVVRRYLRGQAVHEIATALSMRENTAGKRIARALEKLRKLLSRRGVVMPAAALTVVMAGEKSRQAPAAVLSAIGQVGLNNAKTVLAKMILWRLFMTKAYTAMIVGAGLLALAASIVAYENTLVRGATDVAATEPSTRPAFVVSSVTEEHSDRLLREIAAGIEANRRKLRTLRVQATATSDVWNPQKKQWEPIGRCEGTAWEEVLLEYKGEFLEPLKVHIEMDRWLGAARQSQAWTYATALNEAGIGIPMQYDPSDVALGANLKAGSLVETFDGYTTTQIWGPPILPNNAKEQWAPPGAKLAEVTASSGKGKNLSGSAMIGGEFSMQLMNRTWWGQELIGLSFDPAFDPNSPAMMKQKFTARRVVVNGTAAMELNIEHTIGDAANPGKVITKCWFDPARGYGLLGVHSVWDKDGPELEVVVEKTAELAPGFFYPMAGHGEYRINSDRVQQGEALRWTYAAQRVECNVPIPDGVMSTQIVTPPRKFAALDWEKAK